MKDLELEAKKGIIGKFREFLRKNSVKGLIPEEKDEISEMEMDDEIPEMDELSDEEMTDEEKVAELLAKLGK